MMQDRILQKDRALLGSRVIFRASRHCRMAAVLFLATALTGLPVASAKDWKSHATLLVKAQEDVAKDPKRLHKLVKNEALEATSQITLGQAVTALKLTKRWKLDHEACVVRLRKATKVTVRPKTALFTIQESADSEGDASMQCMAITQAYIVRRIKKLAERKAKNLPTHSVSVVQVPRVPKK